jgi:hypothetical protein
MKYREAAKIRWEGSAGYISGKNSYGPSGYLKKGLAGEGYVIIPAQEFSTGGGRTIPNNFGTNPHTDKDEGFPVIYGRRAGLTAPIGYKGISKLFRWTSVSRTTGSTLNNLNRLVVGHVSIPWDGSTTPAV